MDRSILQKTVDVVYVVFWLTGNMCGTYGQQITNGPSNTVVKTGQSTTISCSYVDLLLYMQWNFYNSTNPGSGTLLVQGSSTVCVAVPAYASSYSCTSSSSSSSLQLIDTDMTMSATYECMVGSAYGSAYVVVIDGSPVCPTTVTSEENSYTNVSCSLRYGGLWPPILTWDTSGIDYTIVSYTNTSGLVENTVQIGPFNPSDNGAVISCDSSMGAQPADLPIGSGSSSSLSTYTPTYKDSSTVNLDILYGVQNASIDVPSNDLNVGDNLTCGAEGNPEPSYSWTSSVTGNTVLSTDSVLTIPDDQNMQGETVNFTCTADNNMSSDTYTVQVFIIMETTTSITTVEPTTTEVSHPPTSDVSSSASKSSVSSSTSLSPGSSTVLSTTTAPKSSTQASVWVIVGASIAATLLIVLIGVCIGCLLTRNRQRNAPPPPAQSYAMSNKGPTDGFDTGTLHSLAISQSHMANGFGLKTNPYNWNFPNAESHVTNDYVPQAFFRDTFGANPALNVRDPDDAESGYGDKDADSLHMDSETPSHDNQSAADLPLGIPSHLLERTILLPPPDSELQHAEDNLHGKTADDNLPPEDVAPSTEPTPPYSVPQEDRNVIEKSVPSLSIADDPHIPIGSNNNVKMVTTIVLSDDDMDNNETSDDVDLGDSPRIEQPPNQEGETRSNGSGEKSVTPPPPPPPPQPVNTDGTARNSSSSKSDSNGYVMASEA